MIKIAFPRVNGVASGIYYPIPVHQQNFYKQLGYKDSLPHSEKIADEVLSLPIHPGLNIEDLARIVNLLSY